MNRGSLYVSVIDDLFYLILFFHSSILILGPYTFNWILHSLNTNNSIHIRLDTYSEICIYIISFLKYLFIYFWLHWVFVAALGLSLVAASGCYSLLRCAGFSLWWLLLLRSTGSRRAGFSSCGSRALQRRLSSCGTRALWLCGMWDLPRPGIKPVSPALVGGSLTTAPPGKS